MYNEHCLKLSNEIIEEQIAFVGQCFPEIKQITPIDNTISMESDYIDGIDCMGIYGKEGVTIQLKNRKPGNRDFILPAIKLTGKAAMENENLGFTYNDEKYLFRPKADIYCERLDGIDYCLRKEEIKAAEALFPEQLAGAITSIQPKYVYSDRGGSFFSGEFYVFISVDNLAKIKAYVFKTANRNLNLETVAQAFKINI